MPPTCCASVPSAFRYSEAVGMKGLLESEKTSVQRKSATMTSVTPRATEERSSVTCMRFHATTAA